MLDFKFWILNEEENEESAFFFDPRSMIYDHCRPTVWTWRALSLEFARRHEGFGGMPIASFLRVVDISFE
jgi:hypothetical protein